MKIIISRFFQKHNPQIFVLRFGLTYATVLTICALIILLHNEVLQPLQSQHVEYLLVAAITAVLQSIVGVFLLTLCKTKKPGSK